MKYIIKRFLTGLLILLAPILSLAQTKTTFDKFKNTTHFMTKETPASKVTFDGGKDASILIHRMSMVAGFSCEGQVDSCKPAGIELLFIAHTSDWTMKGGNLSDHFKSGQRLSLQNRPTGLAVWD